MDDDGSFDPKAPELQRGAMLYIGITGGAAFILSVIAEFTRTKSYQYLEDAERTLHCIYPHSNATWYATAAIVTLAAAQFLTFAFGGFAWLRSSKRSFISNTRLFVIIVLVANTLFLLSALSTLIGGAVENAYHTKAVPYGQGMIHCSLVDEGVFISASILTFFSVILMEAYYYLGVRACQEAWAHSYNDPPVVDMEAFGREAIRPSVSSIVSRDTTSISNTPVYEHSLI